MCPYFGILAENPFPGKGAILLGLPPLDPVGGYAPATPFLSTKEVFRQSDSPTARSGLYVLIWLLSVAYLLLVKFILSDTSKTSSPVGIVTFPFVTVSLSLSYDFVYPSMNISGSVTVSPLFV
jgi:hypothetical protein